MLAVENNNNELQAGAITQCQLINENCIRTVVSEIRNCVYAVNRPFSNEAREYHEQCDTYAEYIASRSGMSLVKARKTIGRKTAQFAAMLILPLEIKADEMAEQQASAVSSLANTTFSTSPLDFWMLNAALKRVYKEAEKIRDHLLRDEYQSAETTFTKLEQLVESFFTPPSSAVEKTQSTTLSQQDTLLRLPAQPSAPAPILSPFDCLNEYIEELKTEGQVKAKTIDDYYTKIKLVLDLLGEDNIKNISFKKVKKLKAVIIKYPSNVKKIPCFNYLTPDETIKTNEDLGKPTLSENTLKNYYQRCFTFFLWCVRYEYTVANPFDGNGFKKHASPRTSFKSEHLNAIFSAEHYFNHTFKHAYYYWLPLLGRFTGARINELCQLHVKDIEQIGTNQSWVTI